MADERQSRGEVTSGFWPRLASDLQRVPRSIANFFAPESDACATDECYEINIELPGVAEDDIEVSVRGGVLSVKGEKRAERHERGRTYFFTERSYGAFQRSFRLPPDADAENIAAAFRNGLLTIRIPKSERGAQTHRKIEIKSG